MAYFRTYISKYGVKERKLVFTARDRRVQQERRTAKLGRVEHTSRYHLAQFKAMQRYAFRVGQDSLDQDYCQIMDDLATYRKRHLATLLQCRTGIYNPDASITGMPNQTQDALNRSIYRLKAITHLYRVLNWQLPDYTGKAYPTGRFY